MPYAGLDDLLGGLTVGGAPLAGGLVAAPAAMAAVPAAADPFDLLGSAGPAPASPAAADLPVILTGEKGKGVVVRGRLIRSGGKTAYVLNISNGSAGVVDGFMVQVGVSASVCNSSCMLVACDNTFFHASPLLHRLRLASRAQ
jgi:hypothetical protein